jgi:plasmid stabilization system protein ParE
VAEAEQREVVWTRAAQADLQSIYEAAIPLLGEEEAYELVESIRRKADLLYRPIIGSTRLVSSRYPERNYQKLAAKPHIIVFRQIGQVVFINRIFDTRQSPDKLGL